MAKKNKIRYTSSPKSREPIIVSGYVYLQYRDDEALEGMRRGDMLVFAECKQLHTNYFAQYENTGFTGYFKVDVSDGKEWRPLILNEVFTAHEHHFSKKERPIDTFLLCKSILEGLQGRELSRTYREHYELVEPVTPA